MERFKYDPAVGVSLKEALEAHFGDDSAYGITERAGTDENDRDVCLRFPDGGHAAVCTNYAVAVFLALGPEYDPCLVWIGDRQSPGAKIVVDYESHDFCVVQGRYIVDAWAKNLDGYTPRAVLDMRDPFDQGLIEALYGPEACFNYNSGLEASVRARLAAAMVADVADARLRSSLRPVP